MNKKSFILFVLMFVLLTGCNVKEGQTTFKSLQSKIDNYLTSFDVSSYEKKHINFIDMSTEGGNLFGYLENQEVRYIEANLYGVSQDNHYEIFFIDEAMTYFTVLTSVYNKPIDEAGSSIESETLIEYLLVDGKLALYDTSMETLTEIEDSSGLKSMINDFRELLLYGNVN